MGTWGDKSGVESLDAVVDGRLRARPTRGEGCQGCRDAAKAKLPPRRK